MTLTPADAPPRPTPMPVLIDNIPSLLRRHPRWIVWKWTWNGRKWDKPPTNPHTGGLASTTDPSTWATLEDAYRVYQEGGFDGIGFVFGRIEEEGLHFSGLDIDDCIEEGGRINTAGLYLAAQLNSYTEYSPSGGGLKVFTLGALPPGKRADHEQGLEFYDSARYFTVTGHKVDFSPNDVYERSAVLSRLHADTFYQPNTMSRLKPDRDRAVEALRKLSPSRADGYTDWLAVGMALHSVSEDLLGEWDRWSQNCQEKWEEGECARKWASFRRKGISIRSLIYWAKGDSGGSYNPDHKSRNGHHETNGNGHAPTARPPVIYCLPDLLAMQLPPPKWTIPGIMCEGLTILAGKPKLGKSFLAFNLAVSVAAAGKVFGTLSSPGGDVLYLALEDRLRRVQDRAAKILRSMNCAAPSRLSFSVEWPRQEDGGLDYVAQWLEQVPDPTLVVIDVWAKFRPLYKNGGSQYEQDYNYASTMKSLADQKNCSVLVVHHCKKAAADDVVDEISGTLGFAGAADGLLVMSRARGQHEANLFITGRDVEEVTLALEFSPLTFLWQSHGNAAERTESQLKKNLLDLFKANAGAILSTTEIAGRVNVHEDKVGYLRNLLGRMVDDDLLERVGPGRWRYPVKSADEMVFGTDS